MKTLKELVRPNIWRMKPYSSARNEFHGAASVFLDANENPYNTAFNRYPDPMQWELKKRISEMKDVPTESIFLGNGSDEPIDLIPRVFCEPGKDNVVSITPSYGMYEVVAEVNDIEFRKVQLTKDFDLDVDALMNATDSRTKAIFLCSPNNPSGNSLNRDKIHQILDTFEGITVIDEAYIDFSSQDTFLKELKKYPNLIVLQTLSKAWGAAGLRLGMAFASPEIIAIMSNVKYPYNVNVLTQRQALEVLNNEANMKNHLLNILNERTRLQNILPQLPCVRKIYPTDANFILTDVGDANAVYQTLVDKGVIVRNRTTVTLCEGCLRITVGAPEENDILLSVLKEIKA